MSVEHRRPLYAFFLVLIVAGLAIGHALRSESLWGSPLVAPWHVAAGATYTSLATAGDTVPGRSFVPRTGADARTAADYRVVTAPSVRSEGRRIAQRSSAVVGLARAPVAHPVVTRPASTHPASTDRGGGPGRSGRAEHPNRGHHGGSAGHVRPHGSPAGHAPVCCGHPDRLGQAHHQTGAHENGHLNGHGHGQGHKQGHQHPRR